MDDHDGEVAVPRLVFTASTSLPFWPSRIRCILRTFKNVGDTFAALSNYNSTHRTCSSVGLCRPTDKFYAKIMILHAYKRCMTWLTTQARLNSTR